MANNQTIKLGVWGAAGRMGRAVIGASCDDLRTSLAFGMVEAGSAEVGQDLGLLGGKEPIEVVASSEPGQCDVVIDFSGPAGFESAVAHCAESGTPYVSGTTGLSPAQQGLLDSAGERTPVLWAPNTSYGVLVLRDLVARAANLLGADADIEIIEAHHRHKVDAPSGTALALGESIAAAQDTTLDSIAHLGDSKRSAPRKSGEIGFSSLRAGDIVGDHTVVFALDGERIELTHRAHSRSLFARGAIRAAVWLSSQRTGRYQLSDMLD